MTMMKDYANPALLLAVVGLMTYRTMTDDESAGATDAWVLALCVTGVLVNAALAVSKAITHRRMLLNVVWAGVLLVIGSCAWALRYAPLDEESLAYHELSRHAADPLARDDEGENLLTRAAALGKADDVRRILDTAAPPGEMLCEAGLRAAEGDHVDVLNCLARMGMPADASVNGVSLLHAAAQNGSHHAIKWLLERGARVDTRDADGATALIHATLAESEAAVRMLLEYGADIHLRDASGRSANDYARTPELRQLVSPPAPPQTTPLP